MDTWSRNDKVFDHASMGGWNAGNNTLGFSISDALSSGWDKVTAQAEQTVQKTVEQTGTKVVSSAQSELMKLLGVNSAPATVQAGGTSTTIFPMAAPAVDPKTGQPIAWYKDPLNLGMVFGGVVLVGLLFAVVLKR